MVSWYSILWCCIPLNTLINVDDIILISNKGTLVRTPVAQVATSGRNTQGVTLIRLGADEALVAMARVEDSGEEDELVEAMNEDGLLSDGDIDSDINNESFDESLESDTKASADKGLDEDEQIDED